MAILGTLVEAVPRPTTTWDTTCARRRHCARSSSIGSRWRANAITASFKSRTCRLEFCDAVPNAKPITRAPPGWLRLSISQRHQLKHGRQSERWTGLALDYRCPLRRAVRNRSAILMGGVGAPPALNAPAGLVDHPSRASVYQSGSEIVSGPQFVALKSGHVCNRLLSHSCHSPPSDSCHHAQKSSICAAY